MARKFSMLFIVAILAATLHCSVAQRTHLVGDSLGWTVPPGGPIAYSTWASRQTFTVGDVLIFNFTSGAHDVAEVTKSSFDGCNTSNPISLITSGPANITLRSAGEHHYICTFSGHCGLGQKLAINVSAAPSTSPAPQPSTPSPVPAPSPSTPSPTPTPAPAPSRPPSGPSPAPAPSSPGATPPPSGSTTTPSPSGSTPPTPPSPSGVSAPPPPNSAPSFAVAALPFTFLSIALAFFY